MSLAYKIALIVAAVLLGSPSAAQAQQPINFSGEWWSVRCARLSLTESGDRLSGQYFAHSGPSVGKTLSLTGYRSGTDLIAFAVNFGSNGPIAVWAGQHTIQTGSERIVASWLMTTDVPDEEEEKELYRSIWNGADIFARERPAHCQ